MVSLGFLIDRLQNVLFSKRNSSNPCLRHHWTDCCHRTLREVEETCHFQHTLSIFVPSIVTPAVFDRGIHNVWFESLCLAPKPKSKPKSTYHSHIDRGGINHSGIVVWRMAALHMDGYFSGWYSDSAQWLSST